ncbi:hypothetical protein PAXINDRAFT_93335 [Paxillus involutus ATCC 200175]|uniref:CxC5 like cysteine cluster associated with KDZ domain-containing protein n=1 Tax=Paxillus involutus ATCC 200175 TaxID=664439 RepID=A0A0C9SM47_PAXIN|nr:hypothetical protein PAXINDRAFT_93335 [Paxillus involutus ATCC 200175]
MHDITHPPLTLPTAVEGLLIGVTGMDFESVRRGWLLLKHVVWSAQELLPSSQEAEIFNLHGHCHGLAFHDLYPPTRVCLTKGCPNQRDCNNVATLSDPVKYQAVRFTLGFGALPVHSTSTYCRQCHRRYHHNYVVHKDSDSRIYYGGVPDTVQAASHFFIDSQVLEVFANAKVFGWCVMNQIF